jgi:gamma-polyglutamate synthase
MLTPMLVMVGLVVGYLAVERVRLGRDQAAIPLRIAVTGTRGKSTVARQLAAVLREDGRTVVAKTTGSEAVVVLPDGAERPVKRRGRPSIIEQTRFLRLAATLRAEVAVAEVMSIHAENHRVETERLLRPHVVLITNARVDHTDAMGRSPDAVAEVLALDIQPGARVFVPAGECRAAFRERAARVGATLVEVPESDAPDPDDALPGAVLAFPENTALVTAAARWVGVGDRAVRAGIHAARHDQGAVRVWRYAPPIAPVECYLVNAFAANDPESTLRIHDLVMQRLGATAGRCRGLLSLRADRGDRSAQWLDALNAGAIDRFASLHVCGPHARAVRWRLRRGAVQNPGGGSEPGIERGIEPGIERRPGRGSGQVPVHLLRDTRPGAIMEAVLREAAPGDVVFGFGNMGGTGAELVAHWAERAEPVEV